MWKTVLAVLESGLGLLESARTALRQGAKEERYVCFIIFTTHGKISERCTRATRTVRTHPSVGCPASPAGVEQGEREPGGEAARRGVRSRRGVAGGECAERRPLSG